MKNREDGWRELGGREELRPDVSHAQRGRRQPRWQQSGKKAAKKQKREAGMGSAMAGRLVSERQGQEKGGRENEKAAARLAVVVDLFWAWSHAALAVEKPPADGIVRFLPRGWPPVNRRDTGLGMYVDINGPEDKNNDVFLGRLRSAPGTGLLLIIRRGRCEEEYRSVRFP